MVIDACLPVIDVWTYIGLASTMTLVVIAFFFMIGKILSKSEFEAMARKELSQLFVALILALVIVGLATTSCGVAQTLVQDTIGEGNQFSASSEYLMTLIYGKGIPAIQKIWISGFSLELVSAIKVPIGLPAKDSSLQFSSEAIFRPLVKIIGLFGFLFDFIVGSLHAQLVLIQLSEAFAMTLMLPLGMILRTIPAVRKGGSFLMALAFGLYIVFPMVYVMDYAIYKIIDPNFEGLAHNQLQPLETFKISSEIINIFGYFDSMAALIPQATVLALINITITVSFIESFSTFLNSIE